MSDISDSTSGTIQPYEHYVLDAENAAEMARQMLHDHIITKAMGGPLPDPIDPTQIYNVLDIACGSGGWLFDLTAEYPHMHGVGIDISQIMIAYANSIVKSEGRANAQFQVMDSTKPLNFPDNTFDMVNARLITAFLSTQQWPELLAECRRIIKPGGILRITEAEWAFTNSAALDKLAQYDYLGLLRAGHSFSPHGRTYGTPPILRLLLRQAGYEDIAYQAHAVDYSVGAEAHDSNCQNTLVFHKLIQPFMVQMQVATLEELQRLYEQVEKDIQAEDFCAIDYFLTVRGRKAGPA
jgi:ubiquinone/menaquinone biosynthesis C-methylase UbiE